MQAWQMINQNSLHAVARNKDWAPGPHQVAFTRNLANTFTENDIYTYEESSGGEEPWSYYLLYLYDIEHFLVFCEHYHFT